MQSVSKRHRHSINRDSLCKLWSNQSNRGPNLLCIVSSIGVGACNERREMIL